MTRKLLPLCFIALNTILNAQTQQIPYLELNNLWRLVPYGHYMSSSEASERNEFTSNGLLYYTATTNAPGTVPLYRHYNSSTGDHMDSLNQTEPGYTTDGILGYIWTSPYSFLNRTPSPITGVSDGSYHATIKSNETLSGYSNPTSFGYGLYRYNLDLLSLLSLSAGGVTIQSNGVTGGAIYNWTWNGTQFINDTNFGFLLQSALFNNPPGTPQQNPDEAGDTFSGGTANADEQHGSPTLVMENFGNMQSSYTVPLDFEPTKWGGGSNNPVAYPGMLMGKQITLNYNNLGPVAQYTTTLTVPVALQGTQLAIPTGYLNNNFTQFYTYDASTRTLTNVTSSLPACQANGLPNWLPPSGYGGVIVANSSGSLAMGVYGVATDIGGSVSYFSLATYLSCSAGAAEWYAVSEGSIPAGNSSYFTWIISDTLSGVTSLMNTLVNQSNVIAVNSNPIILPSGQTDGTATISWSAPGHNNNQIWLGAVGGTGTLWADVGNSGSGSTGNWVTNGMVFILYDATLDETLATTTANVQQQ